MWICQILRYRFRGVVSPDQSQALFMISQLAMPDYTLPGILRFPGLAAEVRYRLRVIDHPDLRVVGEGGHTMRKLPVWMNQSLEASGEWLAQGGIQLPRTGSGECDFDST